MALVDHFGRRGEVWKMISVLHAYGEDDAWVAATAVGGGLEGVYRESKQVGVDEQMGEVDVDDGEGGPTLSEMMRQEEEGRKGRTLFGRLRDPGECPLRLEISIDPDTHICRHMDVLADSQPQHRSTLCLHLRP